MDEILARVRGGGVDLAGLVSLGTVLGAPSMADQAPLGLPGGARSVLVLGLAHPPGKPELDWWGGPGGTPGNRILRRISRDLEPWLVESLGVAVWILPYHVEKGGIFLKDAAVLAGLGAMGVNNLVITQELGPRVRWKALLLDLDVPTLPAGSGDQVFDPCAGCDRPCVVACPQRALEDGRYHRSRCSVQMQRDEAEGTATQRLVRYCRKCEQACPVGTLT